MTLPPRSKHRTAAALIFEGGTIIIFAATGPQWAGQRRRLELGTSHSKEAALRICDALEGRNVE
jgi:hypothetical protein